MRCLVLLLQYFNWRIAKLSRLEEKFSYSGATLAYQKLSIVIPVFNEARTVTELLNGVYNQTLPGNLKKEMVIIESNSSDSTRKLVQEFANKNQDASKGAIKILLEEQPMGKGHAVRLGLKNITGDIVLIQDGDLEYDVKDYPQLIEPILEGHADFVLGSRHLSAGGWKIRSFEGSPFKALLLNFGGVFFHGFFNLLYGTRLTDPTTMYKVFKKSCIEGLDFYSDRFNFDFEILGKLIRRGYVPLEVPVTYRSRGFAEGKKVRIFRDPLTWFKAIIEFRFCSLKKSTNPNEKK